MCVFSSFLKASTESPTKQPSAPTGVPSGPPTLLPTPAPNDPCKNVDCGNFGSCESTTGKCVCTDNYSGDNCEIPPNLQPSMQTSSTEVLFFFLLDFFHFLLLFQNNKQRQKWIGCLFVCLIFWPCAAKFFQQISGIFAYSEPERRVALCPHRSSN